ncbi:hypothetical protein U737_08705 [Methylomonas sp. LW13]|uniref:metal-dependent hydrolase n=1 Tax=unclassified Methylomonas TaxID=2608980 RepID=UPI00051B4BBA|nr:metal-dependent hydrolase [Methylomonas sp. LW13]QBC26980.1 hypothetical protein U737_08705 [Methylomonas sp. LW13]
MMKFVAFEQSIYVTDFKNGKHYMSSIVGHALINSAIFGRKHEIKSGGAAFMCMFFIGLGISPDMDYLVYWVFDYQIEPRVTHSILFFFVIGLIASCAKKFVLKNTFISVSHGLFYMASFSHLILDLLVGVHPMPLFWPINSNLIKLPFGILPSAGHIDIKNIYLWRNILIELVILMPVSMLISCKLKAILFQRYKAMRYVFYITLVVGMFVGFSLKR